VSGRQILKLGPCCFSLSRNHERKKHGQILIDLHKHRISISYYNFF